MKHTKEIKERTRGPRIQNASRVRRSLALVVLLGAAMPAFATPATADMLRCHYDDPNVSNDCLPGLTGHSDGGGGDDQDIPCVSTDCGLPCRDAPCPAVPCVNTDCGVLDAWDPDSEVDCRPAVVEEDADTTASCGTSLPGFSSPASSPKCGYGWAQEWAVKVELSTGDARINGHIDCNGSTKASCTIQVGGVKVCEDDGGSEKGPLVCGYTIEEIVERPIKGIIKCTDPANSEAAVSVGFEVLSAIDGPVSFP